MRSPKLFWLCLVLLMAVATPVWAMRLMIIGQSDSLGAEIYDVADFHKHYGYSATVDSMVEAFSHAVEALPESQRQQIWSLNATGTWMIVVDPGGHLPADWVGLTTVDTTAGGTDCPRTFFQGRFFLDPVNNACVRQSAVVHELQHVVDCLNGLLPTDLYQLAIVDFDTQLRHDLAELLVESRGYSVQAEYAYDHGCVNEKPILQSYYHAGMVGLRHALIDHLYAETPPDYRQRLRLAIDAQPSDWSLPTGSAVRVGRLIYP